MELQATPTPSICAPPPHYSLNLSWTTVSTSLPDMSSWLSPPGQPLSTVSAPATTRPLQPGDRDYCHRCVQHGHDRRACPDRPHGTGHQGASCPHPRSSGSTIGPNDSASLVGSPQQPNFSFASLLGSRPAQSSVGPKTWQDVITQPGFENVTEAEARRLADRYNLLLQRATRDQTAQRLRDLGLNPDDILDPLPATVPTTAVPAPFFPSTSSTSPPTAPGTTQIIPFGGAPVTTAPRLVDNVQVGHITMSALQTNFFCVHRATYSPTEIQTALTAAASGTFVNLAYLALRWTLPSVTWGWRIQLRIVQQATLPPAPANINAFAAIGGQLVERDSTMVNATSGTSTITFATPSTLTIPIHVVAVIAFASGLTTGNPAFGQISLEVGANVS